jgi:hypothetical protein
MLTHMSTTDMIGPGEIAVAVDHRAIFEDPVAYLAGLGLEAELVGEPGLPAAA